jgi:hypothetical protein
MRRRSAAEPTSWAVATAVRLLVRVKNILLSPSTGACLLYVGLPVLMRCPQGKAIG